MKLLNLINLDKSEIKYNLTRFSDEYKPNNNLKRDGN